MRHPNQHKHNKNTDPQLQKIKWATFTYSGKEKKKITELFKETHIKLAFQTRNTIKKHSKTPSKMDKYERVAFTK
jgi:hypothetical protein